MRYTVKQVSDLTGVRPERLRAWERRYGVVRPARSESRYRLYDDADLTRLRLMVRLVDEGAPASLAAQQVCAVHGPAGAAPTPGSVGRAHDGPADADVSDAPPPVRHADPGLPDLEALVRVAQAFDGEGADHLLDRAFAAGSFELVSESWLLPSLVVLGEAWVDGRVDVAGEHFVSAVVRRRLGRSFDAAGTAVASPVVLAGLPPGAMHELASLVFATCLRRAGADVRWLGSDLPVEGWVHATQRLHPAAVVLSVPLLDDVAAALSVVRAVTPMRPSLLVFCGGRGAARIADECALLPESVSEAAREVATRLRMTDEPSDTAE